MGPQNGVGRQASATVAWQATVLAAAALLVGLPLGIAAGRLAWTALAHQLGVADGARTPTLAILLALPATVLVANLLAAVPAAAARTRPASCCARSDRTPRWPRWNSILLQLRTGVEESMASGERETPTPSLRQALPALHEAQSAYLAAMDSLRYPDRKTHELIRLACTVILRNGPGVSRHAMLAAEFGASWEDIVGTLVLTQPGFGFIPAMEALPHARHGFEAGLAAGVADFSQLDADDE